MLELTLIGGLVGMMLPTALEYLVQISPAHLSESASAAGLSSVTNIASIVYLVRHPLLTLP